MKKKDVVENRRLLVAALRSGEYPQCQEVLFRGTTADDNGNELDDPGFCCLGVAACVLEGAKPDVVKYIDVYKYGQGEMLMEREAAKFGFSDEEGTRLENGAWLYPTRSQRKLADMNDMGKTFAEIADYIEAMPLPEGLEE